MVPKFQGTLNIQTKLRIADLEDQFGALTVLCTSTNGNKRYSLAQSKYAKIILGQIGQFYTSNKAFKLTKL